jgi:hypothetical protein
MKPRENRASSIELRKPCVAAMIFSESGNLPVPNSLWRSSLREDEKRREISLFASRHVCGSKRERKRRRLAPFEMTVWGVRGVGAGAV